MEKSTKIVLVVSSLVLAAGAFIIIRKQMAKAKEKREEEQEAEDAANAKAAQPQATTTASIFPLKKGSKNIQVKNLQSYLGLTADGAFGAKTEEALKAKTGKYTVDSQAELDKLNPKSTSTTTSKPPTATEPKKFTIGKKFFMAKNKKVQNYERTSSGVFKQTYGNDFVNLEKGDTVMYWGMNIGGKPTFNFTTWDGHEKYFNLDSTDVY